MVFLCRLVRQLQLHLVPENKRASAIAIMFTGLTVATITGVPIGTFIGQQFGWELCIYGDCGHWNRCLSRKQHANSV